MDVKVREFDERAMMEIFTKWRIYTYLSVIFIPPYGLYRIWSEQSTFRRSEKWVWTMVVIVYLVCLLRTIVIG